MKNILFALLFSINLIYAQPNDIDDELYDFGMSEGVTIIGERPKEYKNDSTEAQVLNQLNGLPSTRKRFIETNLLEKSGYRREGNVRYRKTDATEKALSIIHGLGHAFTLGIMPMTPFLEIEYDQLPRGEYYNFEAVVSRSDFYNVAPEVWTIMKIEYILQIQFCNGKILQDNINYYTDEHIAQFEELIAGLPDYPESVKKTKERFVRELANIKAALERYKNPSENYLRAVENMKERKLFQN